MTKAAFRQPEAGAFPGRKGGARGSGRLGLVLVASLLACCWGQPSLAQDAAKPAAAPRSASEAITSELVEWVVEQGLPMEIDPERSKIVRTRRPVTRISIADPKILEVVQFSPTEFELLGQSTGQTSLTFWFGDADKGGQILRYQVRVAPNRATEDRKLIEYKELERRINELFPNSFVRLIPVSDKLIVKGQARDAEEAAQILAVIRGQPPDQSKTGAATPFAASLNQGRAAEPFPDGTKLPASNLINLLQVPGEMQVMLKVRVAELSRSALRKMGAEFQLFEGDFTFSSLLGLANPAVSAVLDTSDVKFALHAIATNSYGKVLAEPNLVTLSGHPAYFIAGGEFAVPVVVGVEGAAAISTNFRGFGTQLTFVPTVLDKDRIRLQVAPSFSQINNQNTVDGIPGLDSRAVATTVELREGQWLAIAGLLQDEQRGSKSRVPVLGDIPVVGAVFSQREVQRDETELLILVSPELIHPLEAEEAPRLLPGMEVTEPNNLAFYLIGDIEGNPACDHRSTYWPAYYGELRAARREAKLERCYQHREDYYLQGRHGFSE